MSFKRALTYSFIINLFFLALCLIFGDLKFGAIDDYFMAARLTGAFGTEYSPHLIFVNAVYGYALLPLYHLFPLVWFRQAEKYEEYHFQVSQVSQVKLRQPQHQFLKNRTCRAKDLLSLILDMY